MLGIITAFIAGFRQAHETYGMTYDNDPESPRSRAYDHGRNWGERLLLPPGHRTVGRRPRR